MSKQNLKIDILNHALYLITEIKEGRQDGGRLAAIEHIIEKTIRHLTEEHKLTENALYAPCGRCGHYPELINVNDKHRSITHINMSIEKDFKQLYCPNCGTSSDSSNELKPIITSWNDRCEMLIKDGIKHREQLLAKVKRYDNFFQPIFDLVNDIDTIENPNNDDDD